MKPEKENSKPTRGVALDPFELEEAWQKKNAATLPKMCPNCGHRCLAPTVTLGDTSCDHCKALKQAHGQALEAVRASIANSLRVWLQESDRTFESLSGIISANLELVQPAASTR